MGSRTSWDTLGQKLLRRMFRVYMKLCHCATVTRGWVGCGVLQAANKQSNGRPADVAMSHASMALLPIHSTHRAVCYEPAGSTQR